MSMRAALLGGLAALAAFTAAQGQPAAPAPAPHAAGLMAATFAVTDLDKAIAFYTTGLGLKAAGRMEHPDVTEVPLLFPAGGATLLLVHSKTAPAAAAAPPRIGRVIVDTPDLRAMAAQLQAAGYPLARPVVENAQHHVLTAVARDPDGNELELVQRPH